MLAVLVAAASGAESLKFPVIAGPLSIDGRLDEPVWRQARILPFRSSGFGAPFPSGGESRMIVRGNWLCVAARLDEPDRAVAFSTGPNAAFGREDLVVWRFSIRPKEGRNRLEWREFKWWQPAAALVAYAVIMHFHKAWFGVSPLF